MIVSTEVSGADSDLELSEEFEDPCAIKSSGMAKALECELGLDWRAITENDQVRYREVKNIEVV